MVQGDMQSDVQSDVQSDGQGGLRRQASAALAA